MTTRILGTGSGFPEMIVTNDDLSTIVDTSDDWISSRTGIKQRRIAVRETTTQLAAVAARNALHDAAVTASEIELIIVATSSPDYIFPNAASLVQAEICADNAVCYDLSAACSGFLFALNTAHAFIKSGIYKKALVIGAEIMSRELDWKDRGTCVLFGDGAGAVVVGEDAAGIDEIVMHSDGRRGEVLTYPGVQSPLRISPRSAFAKEHSDIETPIKNISINNISIKNEDNTGNAKINDNYIKMDGQEVFKFAVKQVPESINELIEKAQIDINDIKYFVLHQANIRIIQSVAKRLGVNADKFPTNLLKYGNTSAASIPILLDEINREGLLNRGDRIVLSGFGGGLSWGATLLTW